MQATMARISACSGRRSAPTERRSACHWWDNVRDHVFTGHPWLAADPALGRAGVGGLRRRADRRVDRADECPLPAELMAFLDAGALPVYVGFGSMPMRAAKDIARVAIEVIPAGLPRTGLPQLGRPGSDRRPGRLLRCRRGQPAGTVRPGGRRRAPGGLGPEAMDRDMEIHRLTARLCALRRFDLDLSLGRIVSADNPEPVYIGRLGLTDSAGRRLLLDWRSPRLSHSSGRPTPIRWAWQAAAGTAGAAAGAATTRTSAHPYPG
jgi:hypothetical protein